jgi:hypothetical protein
VDHTAIEAENIAERHLLGQLTAEEAARFEEHYLDCPECLEKLELTRRLQIGLREIAAEEGARTLAFGAMLAGLLRRPALRAALGLGLLVAVVLPWTLLLPARSERERLAGELEQARAPQAGTPVVTLSPERSGPAEEASTRITLGAAEWVTLALEPPPAPSETAASYQVRLLDPDGKLRWQSGALSPDATGRVSVSLHASWLPGGPYQMELERQDGETARFAFRVQRQP